MSNILETNMVTIGRWVCAQQRKKGASGEFSQLMESMVSAIKAISSAVRVAGLNNLFGMAGTGNASGDDQVDYFVSLLYFIDLIRKNWMCCQTI